MSGILVFLSVYGVCDCLDYSLGQSWNLNSRIIRSRQDWFWLRGSGP